MEAVINTGERGGGADRQNRLSKLFIEQIIFEGEKIIPRSWPISTPSRPSSIAFPFLFPSIVMKKMHLYAR